MAEVDIERCTLRVIRRGGWSWGPEPRRIVEAATRALPLLLARHLEALWPEDADGEIRGPPPLTLRVKLEDLAELTRELALRGVEAAVLDDARVAALDAELAQAVASLGPRLRRSRRLPDAASPQLDAGAKPSGETAVPPADAFTVLRTWRQRGWLPWLLRTLDGAALRLWLRALEAGPPLVVAAPPRAEIATADAEIEQLARTLLLMIEQAERARPPSPAAVQPGGRALRCRLLLAVELAVRLRVTVASLRPLLERLVPLVAIGGAETEATTTAARTSDKMPHPPPPPPRRHRPSPSPRAADGDMEVSALPFLLLSPLAQIGLLDALEAAFTAAGRPHQLAAVAAGLAVKALPPPDRGWRRRPEDLISQCCFAGVQAVPDDLAALADEPLADLLPPLEALVARALFDAHSAGSPYVIEATGDELLLADAEGLSPIAHGSAAWLTRLLDGVTDPLLILGDAAEPSFLAELHARGCRFITNAPPVRDEPWRRLRAAPGDSFWSNDANTPDAAQCAQARPLADLGAELSETWRGLMLARAVAPRSRTKALDGFLSLVSGLGLAFLAWTLWRGHPQKALASFGDLTARAHSGDGALELTLPLGGRERDLRAHRLLGEVKGVPWLPARVVRFSGG